MASSRPGIVLLIVSFSVFAIWQALSFLDSRVFRAEVESGHFAVHRTMPSTPTPMIDEYVTTTRADPVKMTVGFYINKIVNNYCCFCTQMKGLNVPFYLRYDTSVCYEKWLCGSPKCRAHLHEASTTPTFA